MAEFDILYGKGISKTGEILDLAVEAGIVEKSGAWFSYNDERIAQGRDKARAFLEEHPEVTEEIENKIRAFSENGTLEAALDPMPLDDDDDDGFSIEVL